MVLNYQGSNHLLRMVMEPKYLPEKVIIHPNHHLTKVIGSLLNPFWTFFASQKKIQTPKFNLPRALRMRAEEDWHRGEERLGFCWIRGFSHFTPGSPKFGGLEILDDFPFQRSHFLKFPCLFSGVYTTWTQALRSRSGRTKYSLIHF